ncbi:hypothetical protein CsSME_00025408 [Camellia sinensis var. sinensis]
MEAINTTIILRCKGVDFPVKVCEEQGVTSEVIYKQCRCYGEQPQTENSTSNGKEQDQVQRSIVGSKEGEDEADVEGHVGSVLDNTGDAKARRPRVGYDDYTATDGQLRELSLSRVEETIMSIGPLDCLQKHPGGGVEACGSQSVKSRPTPFQIQNEDHQIIVDDVITPGFMKSLSGPEKDAPGLNIEVVLRKAHSLQCGTILGHRSSELSDPNDLLTGEEAVQNSNGKAISVRMDKEPFGETRSNTAVGDQKRKTTTKEKGKGLMKYHRKKKGNLQIGVGSVLNFRKGAIFRSAAAAISLSMASKSGSGQLLLNEAEATLKIGKVLGLKCKGNDEEVISKLMELEVKDKERLGKKGSKAE